MQERTLEFDAYRLLYDNISDFSAAAVYAESEINHLGLNYESNEAVPSMEGRTHHEVWVSLKTVSHFNLGVALELMLKLLLFRSGISHTTIPVNERHSLTRLYDELPPQCKEQLEVTLREVKRELPNSFQRLALVNKASPNEEPPPEPPYRDYRNLRGFFEYLDKDVLVSQKRYSWERVRDRHWRHYLGDIAPFVEFINRVMRDVPRDELAWSDK